MLHDSENHFLWNYIDFVVDCSFHFLLIYWFMRIFALRYPLENHRVANFGIEEATQYHPFLSFFQIYVNSLNIANGCRLMFVRLGRSSRPSCICCLFSRGDIARMDSWHDT